MLYVGRVTTQKGPDTLIEAVPACAPSPAIPLRTQTHAPLAERAREKGREGEKAREEARGREREMEGGRERGSEGKRARDGRWQGEGGQEGGGEGDETQPHTN